MSKKPGKVFLKKDDVVLVLRGKQRPTFKEDGQKVYTRGRVLKIDRLKSRVLVEGVNIVKKHVRASKDEQPKGIVECEAPINISNVMLEDPKLKVPTRVGYKFIEKKDGSRQKVRFAKRSGKVLDG
ncbi:MAG: ribosomal protein [Bacillota bacterium]